MALQYGSMRNQEDACTETWLFEHAVRIWLAESQAEKSNVKTKMPVLGPYNFMLKNCNKIDLYYLWYPVWDTLLFLSLEIRK